jgi:hypothetical protein
MMGKSRPLGKSVREWEIRGLHGRNGTMDPPLKEWNVIVGTISVGVLRGDYCWY